jgi:uncharacterized membrane protein
MPGAIGTLAQRSSIAFAASYLVTGTIGLILNPDFGTGTGTSAEQFLVDWNGWHAVLTLLLVPAALFAAARPARATRFLAYNAVANGITATWALFDRTPLGILDLPNVATDVALHLTLTAGSAALLLVQLRRDRVVPAHA